MQIRLSKPLAIDILFVSKFPSCTRSLSAIPPPPLPAPYGCLRLALPPLLKAEETERKAEETKEKEKKSKGGVSCPLHDNCFYIIKVALLGGGRVVAHTYSASDVQPLSGGKGLMSRAAKPFIYP